ncbi:Phage-related minor tail protein [Providencia rustigianii]|uniref:Phage-related minor tail protein n=1 Tax=Providencia rustigianii TaxID=158850 RepID=A0A379G4J4_9GAMM|nr:phage tail tape measure protein [Providencia rustigianii]SUC35811.1 Phage-related minor tail protein [Providencia rustigianii]
MATLRELILKISANSSSFQAEVSKASRISNEFYKNASGGSRQLRQELIQQKKALSEINVQLSSVAMTAKASAGALIGFFSASAAISTVDEWGQMSARITMALKSVEGSAQRYDEIQQRFLTISNRNGKAIETTQELYIGTASAMKELNYNTTQTVDYIESMSSAFTANATSAQKTESALNAINKATIEGKVAGENWKAIMSATPSVLVDIANELERTNGGMKVTESQVKKLAAEGKISFKLFADAIINAKNANNELANGMDNTVADGFTRVANSAKSFFGELNRGTGATKPIVSLLISLSDNFDKVAVAGSLMVGVGLSRYLGNLTLNTKNLAKETVNGYLSQVNHTNQQIRSIQVTQMQIKDEKQLLIDTRHSLVTKRMVAATDKERLILDNQLAKNTKALIALSNQETAANTKLAASRRLLNNMTSVTSTITRGFSGLLSLVGGLPGAIMLGAGAWYAVKQQQDAAHRSALEYAGALDEVAKRTKGMTLTESSDEAEKVKKTLEAQRKEYVEKLNLVQKIRADIKASESRVSQNFPDLPTAKMKEGALKNHTSAVQFLAVEEDRLKVLEQEREKTLSVLNGLTEQANRQIDVGNTAKSQKLAAMAKEIAQESEFNRILSIGNSILSTRQSLTQAPMLTGDRPELNDNQRQMLWGAEQERILASMKQRDQIKQRSQWEAESAFSNDDHKTQYVNDKLKAFDEREKMNNSLKSGNALTKEADRVTERYKDKMADLSVAIEVQRVRALQGEKAAALYAAGHETGAKWTDEQRKAIQSSSVQLAEWAQKADEAVRKQREMTDALKDLKDATRKYNDDAALARSTVGMGDRRRRQEEERQQVERVFSKTDGGLEALKARQDALDALNNKYKEAAIAETDWRAGVSAGLENWVNDASNYAGQAASATQSAMTGMVDNVANALNGNKADWKSWSVDVLKSVQKVLINMAIVNSMKAAGGYFGGGFGSFMSSIIPNAKGGVYDSPSLSSYSGQIVNSPTMFAFAKGAGLMGEAGPEAIMPLTRGSDGSLGVRVLGLENIQNGTTAITSNNAMNIDIGDINLISEGSAEQQPAGDIGGAKQQLRSEIVKTINEQASREGTPLYQLINRRRG